MALTKNKKRLAKQREATDCLLRWAAHLFSYRCGGAREVEVRLAKKMLRFFVERA